MKRGIVFYIFLFAGIGTFAQKNNDSDNNQDKNKKSDQETRYTEGASGVKRSIAYKFSNLITDEDPGNGTFRYNRDTVSKSTFIFVDIIDISGEDQTKWYSTWEKSTGATGRGQLNLVEYEGKNVNVFNITGVFIEEKGYWKIPVEYVSGSLPSNGVTYYYIFERIENKDKTAKEEKHEQESKVEEVTEIAAAVTVAAIVAEPEVEPVVQITQPEPVVEVREEPETQPEPVVEVKQEQVAQPEPVIEVKEEPVVHQETVKEESKIEEVAAVAAVGTVAVASQIETPKKEPRVRTTEPGQPAPKPQTTQPGQSKTTTQSSQPQKPAPVKKETPASQPAPKTNQPAPKPAQPESRPAQPQTAQTARYPSSGSGSSGNVFKKRSDGSRIFHGIIETGYGFKVSDYGINNYRINFIGSFSLGQHFMIGLGVGYRRYFDKPEKHTDWYLVSSKNQVPVFLDLRYLFTKKQLTPYVALGIGGSTEKSKSDTTTFGSFVNPSAGIWYKLSKNTALFAGFAYEGIEMEFAKPVDNIPFRRKNNSISLNIGIQF